MYEEIKDQMCDVCHKMWQLGWVAANDGNVSVKLEDGTFLATPTGISKSFITPEKIVHIDKDANIIEANGDYRPSSEIKMHLRCYKEREDVGAVLHAHPPVATGYAVANVPLDEYSMIETVIAIGSIPVTPYGTPSTYEVPDAIAPYLGEHDVVLLQNHGALSVGADLLRQACPPRRRICPGSRNRFAGGRDIPRRSPFRQRDPPCRSPPAPRLPVPPCP